MKTIAHQKIFTKAIYTFLVLFYLNNVSGQNSLTGDGFGGRLWYVPHNYHAGAYSAYAICGVDHQLVGWGANNWGELGNGTYVSTTAPVMAIGMTNIKFAAAGYITAAIKTDNTAWVWGSYGGLPSGFSNTPVQVSANAKFVDGGLTHAVIVANDGTVTAVGQNRDGELGTGTTSMIPVTTPVPMTGINNAVRAVAVGYNSPAFGYGDVPAATIILLADGTVKVTGGGGWFQATNSTIPVTMPGLNNIVDIKGNAGAAFALDANGDVYAFGRDFTPNVVNDTYPVLGLGTPTGLFVPPTKIIFPPGASSIVALSTNNDGYSTYALDEDHKVYTWGMNNNGQLGIGSNTNQNTPVLVATNVIDILAGESFCYLLKNDNTLWAAGQSIDGSIWMNLSNQQRNVFTQINPTLPPMNLCNLQTYGTVPVRLLTFKCMSSGEQVALQWASAEEINFDKYIVQKSANGIDFENLATVTSKGSNSWYQHCYSQLASTTCYRLKMLDKDGKFNYSETCCAKTVEGDNFIVAPNPTHNDINIYSKTTTYPLRIEVYSSEGNLLMKTSLLTNQQKINLGNFQNGIYTIKVIFKNGKVNYTRIIKI